MQSCRRPRRPRTIRPLAPELWGGVTRAPGEGRLQQSPRSVVLRVEFHSRLCEPNGLLGLTLLEPNSPKLVIGLDLIRHQADRGFELRRRRVQAVLPDQGITEPQVGILVLRISFEDHSILTFRIYRPVLIQSNRSETGMQ